VIELRVSEAAALSIVEQADYYEQVSDRSLALRWEVAVDEAIGSLLKFPERGARCRFRSSELVDLRWIFVPGFPKHLVFYRHLPHEEAVLIVNVLHGARDLAVMLAPDA
jgi:plasmid stabilization system protein ParE